MTRVELEITPEPTPEERAAIEAALAQGSVEGADAANAWWRSGVLEAVEGDDPEAPA